MASKNIGLSVVYKYAQKLIKALQLDFAEITFHVISSKDKKARQLLSLPPVDCLACVWYDHKNLLNKTFILVIYHDKHPSKKEILASLIHELIHIKIRIFDKFIKKSVRKNKLNEVEEEFVHSLERLIVEFL